MDKAALINTACDELLSYGLWDAQTKAKRWIKKYVFRRPVDVEDLIFWPTGLLAAGLWGCRKEDPEKIDRALLAYYERWMRRGCPVSYPDDLLAGETLLAAYEEYSQNETKSRIISKDNADRYRGAIEKLAEYALSYPADEAGSLPYRAGHNNGHVYVDSIGLICPFLYEYGIRFKKQECMELAVNQIVNFLAYGIDGATGLPYHGYVTRTGEKYGIVGWGRAVGWLLRGMTGCLTTEYNAERLKDSFIRLLDTVLMYQRGDGSFPWQMQAADGPKDTSATGMICVALKRGIEMNILTDSKYGQALQSGIDAIEKSTVNGQVYDCSGECEGFGRYPQQYGAYPWALGPALMLV